MKIEKITDNIIKVTISCEDMEKWNVTYNNISTEDENSTKMIWDIIQTASKETGISFDNCRLVIKVLKKDEDDYIIFITKKGISDDNLLYKQKKYRYTSKPLSKNVSSFIYTFKELDNLIEFTKNNLYFTFLFDGKNSLYSNGREVKLLIKIMHMFQKI